MDKQKKICIGTKLYIIVGFHSHRFGDVTSHRCVCVQSIYMAKDIPYA